MDNVINLGLERSDKLLTDIAEVINLSVTPDAPFLAYFNLPTILEPKAEAWIRGGWVGFLEVFRDSMLDMCGRFVVKPTDGQYIIYKGFLEDIENGRSHARLYIWYDNGHEVQIVFTKAGDNKYYASNAWWDDQNQLDKLIDNYCEEFDVDRKELLRTWRNTLANIEVKSDE